MAKIRWQKYAPNQIQAEPEQWNVDFFGNPESDAAGNPLAPVYEPQTAMTDYDNPGRSRFGKSVLANLGMTPTGGKSNYRNLDSETCRN